MANVWSRVRFVVVWTMGGKLRMLFVMDGENKEIGHNAAEGSGKGAMFSLFVLALVFLFSIYYGKPLLEKFTGSLKEKQETKDSVAAKHKEVVPVLKETGKVPVNHEGLGVFVPLLEQTLREIEGRKIKLLYLGLHDERDEVAVDYEVEGGVTKKEALMERDKFGRLRLLDKDGKKVLRTMYPPEGFGGFQR